MISYSDARAMILERCAPLGTESRSLADARNCFLSSDLCAPFPIPRFDHSAVDGFAILCDDAESASPENPIRLQVIGTVRTGDAAKAGVERGCAVKVFTGAMLPPGADGVVMVEDVVIRGESIELTSSLRRNKNIRRAGEEFGEGDVCLERNVRLTPPAVGLAASLGITEVNVFRIPRVAVIVTGSELVSPGLPLGVAQIYDSNRIALRMALAELGIDNVESVSCSDNENTICETIESALRNADVVITSGGASVGEVDYVKPAIKSLGGTIHFDKVAIKPGKPTVFAEVKGKPLFGLPGNPVSALVTCLLFVRPALLKVMGGTCNAEDVFIADLDMAIVKRSSRTEFVRAKRRFENGRTLVTPCRGQDSHMLGGLAAADCLIMFEGEGRALPAGSVVQALHIYWS